MFSVATLSDIQEFGSPRHQRRGSIVDKCPDTDLHPQDCRPLKADEKTSTRYKIRTVSEEIEQLRKEQSARRSSISKGSISRYEERENHRARFQELEKKMKSNADQLTAGFKKDSFISNALKNRLREDMKEATELRRRYSGDEKEIENRSEVMRGYGAVAVELRNFGYDPTIGDPIGDVLNRLDEQDDPTPYQLKNEQFLENSD
ncbi:MAG TPA: hypothetical protein VLE89_05545 [Chlamydiales bacterium]|nr:hypothetical protein [Chlamydiales bacterium]